MKRKTRSAESAERSERREALYRQIYTQIFQKLQGDHQAELEEVELMKIRDILGDVLSGIDVRKTLGIKARRGAPPINEGYGLMVAAHYYAYCDTEPNEKSAASKVAEWWALSAAAVRRIARENRVRYLAWISQSRLPLDTPNIAQMRRAEIERLVRGAQRTYR
jgi:hypothetical protein